SGHQTAEPRLADGKTETAAGTTSRAGVEMARPHRLGHRCGDGVLVFSLSGRRGLLESGSGLVEGWGDVGQGLSDYALRANPTYMATNENEVVGGWIVGLRPTG